MRIFWTTIKAATQAEKGFFSQSSGLRKQAAVPIYKVGQGASCFNVICTTHLRTRIDYNDFFSENCLRETKFCIQKL